MTKPHIKGPPGVLAPINLATELKDLKRIEGAAIQNPAGTLWGLERDILLAYLIWQHVKRVAPGQKPPDWVEWADCLRQMRVLGFPTDKCTRQFNKAAVHPDWAHKILSPHELWMHWSEIENA